MQGDDRGVYGDYPPCGCSRSDRASGVPLTIPLTIGLELESPLERRSPVVIRTLAAAAALAGAILSAPVAQAQPDSSTGSDSSHPAANWAAIPSGPTPANKFVPTITATPFGDIIARQPGLATALANGNTVVPTGIPAGFPTPMVNGNMVGPTTVTTPLSGVVRTRHGRAGGTFVLGRLFG